MTSTLLMPRPTTVDNIRDVDWSIESPTYWYVATPYSKFPDGLFEAHVAACRVTAKLIKAGIPCFSPIAHSHPIAIHGMIDPMSHAIWLPADRPLMDAAHGLIVVELEGWDESEGIAHEIEVFRRAGKPVVHLDPA